jgi:glycosyltransferase involved in cell wall biosynthesis
MSQFTIVVTVYEREGLMPNILSTILRQKLADWNVIFVADGAHPVARAIFDDFLTTLMEPGMPERFSFVTLPSAPGKWGNVSRRRGLELATGDYTVIIGHDCMLYPDYLLAHAENIARVPGCLSLVDIDWWVTREYNPQVLLPHPMYLGVRPSRKHPVDDLRPGEVDLTCMAFPTIRACELGVFKHAQERHDADYFGAYLRCAHKLPVIHQPGVVAAHF